MRACVQGHAEQALKVAVTCRHKATTHAQRHIRECWEDRVLLGNSNAWSFDK